MKVLFVMPRVIFAFCNRPYSSPHYFVFLGIMRNGLQIKKKGDVLISVGAQSKSQCAVLSCVSVLAEATGL